MSCSSESLPSPQKSPIFSNLTPFTVTIFVDADRINLWLSVPVTTNIETYSSISDN